jgi:hypothetical protein
MTRCFATAILALPMLFGGLPAASSETAAAAQNRQASSREFSTPHRDHRRGYAYRGYPQYYGRPHYYAPNRFFLPLPPLWGYGWEWW